MHLWPSTRLRDSFKKDYLNKLQFNFRRKQQQEDATSSAKLLNGDDDNVGQVNKDDGVCCIFCKDFLLIFSLCFCCEDGDEHWVCPTGDMIKVNSDAAIFETSNCFSFAFVVRDAEGRLIEARSRCCPGQVNPADAEAMGIREALSWIKDHGKEAVTVETDCVVAVQAIRSDCPLLSYFGRIIQECKQLVAELRERRVTIKFVKRSANHVAHYLASLLLTGYIMKRSSLS